MTKKLVLFLSIMAAPALAWGDTLQISCVPLTDCTAGAVTQITYNPSPLLDLSNNGHAVGGTAYLAILIPNGPWPAYVTYPGAVLENPGGLIFGSGKLGDLLGEPGFGGSLSFDRIQSASAEAGVIADFFTAYEQYLGAYNSPGHDGLGMQGILLNNFPRGTVVVGWVEDARGRAVLATHLGVGLAFAGEAAPGPVPEPGSLLLVGTGLLMAGNAAWKRFGKK